MPRRTPDPRCSSGSAWASVQSHGVITPNRRSCPIGPATRRDDSHIRSMTAARRPTHNGEVTGRLVSFRVMLVCLVAVAAVSIVGTTGALASSVDSALSAGASTLTVETDWPPSAHSTQMLSSNDTSSSESIMEGEMPLSHAGKMQFWSWYVAFNYLGSAMCLVLIAAVCRLPNRSSSDVLVAALCWSCCVMSLSCGTQCLLNVIASEFAFGRTACYVEALFHLISIITMFFVLAIIAYDSHRTVRRGESMGVKKALLSVFASWGLSATGVGLFSIESTIFMSPSGVFCFFKFDSMLMYAFFLPAFLIAAGAMIYFYTSIFKTTRRALAQMGHHLNITDSRKQVQMRLAQKLFLFVVIFLASWIGLVLGILLQLIFGDIFKLDAIGGLTGVMHSLAVPIAHGIINPRLRTHMIAILTCGYVRRAHVQPAGSVYGIDQSKISGKSGGSGGPQAKSCVAPASSVYRDSDERDGDGPVTPKLLPKHPRMGRQGSMLSATRITGLIRSGSPVLASAAAGLEKDTRIRSFTLLPPPESHAVDSHRFVSSGSPGSGSPLLPHDLDRSGRTAVVSSRTLLSERGRQLDSVEMVDLPNSVTGSRTRDGNESHHLLHSPHSQQSTSSEPNLLSPSTSPLTCLRSINERERSSASSPEPFEPLAAGITASSPLSSSLAEPAAPPATASLLEPPSPSASSSPTSLLPGRSSFSFKPSSRRVEQNNISLLKRQAQERACAALPHTDENTLDEAEEEEAHA